MPLPSDTDPGSNDSTATRGGGVPTPPELRPPRLPAVPVPRGTRRREPLEVAVTTRLERIDPDPAPLPPAPAAAEASRWLARSQSAIDVPDAVAESNDTTRPLAMRPPAAAPRRPGHSSLFTALLAVTMLAVGMVIGALLAGR